MAEFTGFIGPGYTGRATAAVCDPVRNLYPEFVESGTGKNRIVYHGTPGLTLCVTAGTGPVRAAFAINGRAFVVSGNKFYEITKTGATYSAIERGTVKADGAAQITGNGFQILILTGGFLYCFTLDGNVFEPVTTSFVVQSIAFMDSYICATEAETKTLWISGVYDGRTWDALDFASKEGWPDNIQGCFADHGQLWLLGNETSEMWVDTGNSDFPFERAGGMVVEQGLVGPTAICKLDNSIYWIGRDSRGAGIVWRAHGVNPGRVSNHAVEYQLVKSSRLNEAKLFSYQREGHGFLCISVPDLGSMLVYDAATNMWHERTYYTGGQHTLHLAQCYMFAFGRQLVGSRVDGKIYDWHLDNYSDAGTPIRRERIAPYIHSEQKWIFHQSMRLDVEPQTGATVYLQFSDDGGTTWSAARGVSMASMPMQWNMLGRSRSRLYRVWSEAAVKHCWIGAQINVEQGLS